jgi:hypothetical protein
MENEQEAFIQRIENLAEIVKSSVAQNKSLLQEIEGMMKEHNQRWPINEN